MPDPLWINADGGAPEYSANELRTAMALPMMHDGRPVGAREGVRPGGDQLLVSLDGSDILAEPGVACIDPGLSSPQGPYWAAWTSQTTVDTLEPPDLSDPRKDRVWARVYDHDEDSSGMRTAVIEYEAGTPDPSPSAPSVPAGAIPLALIDIPADGQGSPSVADERRFTAAAGGILLVADDTERDALDAYASLCVWNLDAGELEVYDGSDWRTVPHLEPGQQPPTQRIATEVVTSDSGGVADTETSIMEVTAPLVAGRTYGVSCMAFVTKNGGGADEANVKLREGSGTGGDQLTAARLNVPDNGTPGYPVRLYAEHTAGSTGDQTFSLTLVRDSGSNDVRLEAQADRPGYLYVDFVY